MSNFLLLLLSLFVCIFLIYNILILVKRKEYESNSILKGYNVLIFGLFVLMLAFFVRFIKFLLIEFQDYVGFLIDFISFFDLVSNVFLLSLFAVSFLVGVFVLKEV